MNFFETLISIGRCTFDSDIMDIIEKGHKYSAFGPIIQMAINL